MLQTDHDFFKRNLATTAKVGKPPTPETIRQGTVRMELHPDYDAAIQKAQDAGFEVRVSGFASVDWIEVYDQKRNLLRVEKVLNVLSGMRFLDLEHELGHIEQFRRFEDQVPPTDRVVELPNRRRKQAPNLKGILTVPQSTITEYHNRLVEFLRLYDRGVNIELLIEHASGVESSYYEYSKKGIKEGRSPRRKMWANKYFGDIAELSQQYEQAMQVIKAASDSNDPHL